MQSPVPPERTRDLNGQPDGSGPVLLWISRDQRMRDNWAYAAARELADRRGVPLIACFCLMPRLGAASRRHFDFMVDGLRELERDLGDGGVPLDVLAGDPAKLIPEAARRHEAGSVVCDFSPLTMARRRRRDVAAALAVSMTEVDAHNIVPAWVASDKREHSAFHMRNRLARLLPHWLTEPPAAKAPAVAGTPSPVDWEAVLSTISADDVGPPLTVPAGEKAALATLERFVEDGLSDYSAGRNDPNRDAQSGLSPYLHFGQLSAQRAAWEVNRAQAGENGDDFLDELVTWREVAENHCFYNADYARFRGLQDWSRRTLDDHRDDPREYLYELDQLEHAQTHDELWNAAQREMTITGRMHGYMRMYWAKKILEWSPSPEEAMRRAIRLNDRYELDGRDPNGYVGVAWAIGGTLDRPWREREVYGKIRYMNENGARRKFDVDGYIARIDRIAGRPPGTLID
jgi:deoxyribodipyrimidine photo-lyase